MLHQLGRLVGRSIAEKASLAAVHAGPRRQPTIVAARAASRTAGDTLLAITRVRAQAGIGGLALVFAGCTGITRASRHPSTSISPTLWPHRAAPAGAIASCAVTFSLWAVAALLAAAPAHAQTLTIERIPGEESFAATAESATAKFRIRARGSDAPWRGANEHAGITVGVKFDYEGRDLESWENSNHTKSPGNKVSRFEVVLARSWEASGSVTGNRFWDLMERDMGNADLHLIGPVIVRLYDPPGGRTYSLGSNTEICLVINESDGTAGEPCSSQANVVLPERLTASFDSLPASHDGQTAFSLRIQFSEDIDATVADMRDHALNVSGGTVTGAARVNNRDDLWSFTITPSGDAKVEIILAGGASCTADGAICTSDGRQLSTGLLTFVSGPRPTLSIADAEAYEGVHEHMTFYVSMDRAPTDTSWVNYATADGTAEAGSDYTAKSGELRYYTGEKVRWQIDVPILDDTVDDDGETFTVTLSDPSMGLTIGDGVATGTIRNSEDPVEISIGDAEATEGEDRWMRFPLSLNRLAPEVRLDFATVNGTATAGEDFTASSGTLTLRPGTVKADIFVAIADDTVEDDGETFTVTLSNVSGAEVTDGEATGTIRDGEPPPPPVSTDTLWSADMSVTDFGNGSIGAWGTDKFSNVGGSANLEAKWLWYATADRKLTLAFTTATPNTTGLSLYMGDVEVAFPDGGGDSSFSWTDVDVAWTDGDTIPVRIARSGAVVVPSVNTAPTGLPAISGTLGVGDTLTASIDEIADADGLENATFAYQWLSHDGTSDTDIEGATDSTYTLAAADAGKTLKVQVTFTDDGGTEETLVSEATDMVNTAPTGLPAISGTLGVGDTLTASIDEIADADGLENATFAYQWLSHDGTSDTDIEGATDSIYTLAAADAGKTLKVQVTFTDDGGTEETLVSEATDAVAVAGSGQLSVADAEATEEEDSTLVFVVALSPAASDTVTVDYATSDGTATAGEDYTATSGTLTFVVGDTAKAIAVPITDDTVDDGGETFTLTLSNASGAGVRDAEATGTIRNTETTAELSVADAEASEEEDAALEFVVALNPAASDTVTVDYATSDGTATAGEDYTATSGTLTFVVGDTTKTVSVPITDDTVDDGGETFTLTLSNASSGVQLGDAEATGTIRNTETTPELSVADAEATEEEDSTLEFVVTLDPAARDTVTVDYATSDGTATAGEDYTATSGTLTFTAGDTTKTVSVPITDDTVDDGGETFTLTLSNASGAGLGDAEATGTIRNTETTPALSVADAEVTEEEDSTLDFVVALNPAASDTVTVDYATSDGTATAGEDYTATSGTLTFTAGDTTKTISVPITDDAEDDGGETLTLTLNNASGAEIADAEATGTILNTETPPLTASFSDMPASHKGEDFTFGLAFSEEVEVSYVTLRDTAFVVTGGEVSQAQRQQQGSNQAWNITVDPDGQGAVTIVLPETTDCRAADAICTLDERPLSHSLSSVVAGPVIIPAASVSDASAAEGDAVAFTVSLSAASSQQVTVEYATSDGTAAAGSDYTAESGTLTFAANETSKAVSVATTDDSVDEDNETFTLTLSSPTNATLGDAAATGTINDDDESLPTVSVSDASAAEGDAVEFTVSLSEASSQQVAVDYGTSNGTAESGTDFTAQSGTLTFAANETSKTVSVATTDDSVDEEDETFTLTLSSPANATLGDATAIGTINDNDVATTPLTASFSNMPASHTGAEFTFGLAFSEEVELSYVTLRDTAFAVTGGAVRRAQRQQQGSNQAWNITVEPTSANDTVTITLPETTDCDAVDAICTHDGRPLSHSLSAMVVDAASATAGDAANGVVADDALDAALALADGVTPDEAAAVLFGERRLSEAQLTALDRLGNRNGSYDLGDVLSWIERCRRGEARCGRTSTDSGPASSATLLGVAAAGRRRTSKQPKRGDSGHRGSLLIRSMRRRARKAGYALAMLLAATMAWSCTDDSVGPTAPAAAVQDPGFLTVEWTGPAAARDIGVLLELEGPGIETVRAPGLELYQSSAPGRHQVVVVGSLRAGPLMQFKVPDRGQLPLYRVRVVQVTGEDYALKDVAEYRAVITLH